MWCVCVGLHVYRYTCLSILLAITRSLTPLMAKCFLVNNIVLCAYVRRNMVLYEHVFVHVYIHVHAV